MRLKFRGLELLPKRRTHKTEYTIDKVVVNDEVTIEQDDQGIYRINWVQENRVSLQAVNQRAAKFILVEVDFSQITPTIKTLEEAAKR